ncbi:MAG: hypothetical protein V1696_03115 [Candidatus Jorgensenbacteria bacterium]
MNKKLLITLIGIIMLGASVAIAGWWMFSGRPDRNQSMPSVPPTASSTPSAGRNNILGVGMITSSQGPIDLIVTDPDGYTITPTTTIPSDFEYLRQIPGVLYYSEMEKGADGNPIDRVYSYTAKIGDYLIKVLLASNATPTSTYNLNFSVGDQSITLAQNTPVSQIPQQGYGVRVAPNGSISPLPLVLTIPSVQTGKAEGMKTYINTEFGFEFQYPANWEIRENVFGSPASKFNLNIVPNTERYLPDPVLINVVTSSFGDRAFQDLENITSKITVGGISGKRYDYEFEGMQRTSILLPFGELRIILGSEQRYEDVFNQVISSFKFLK